LPDETSMKQCNLLQMLRSYTRGSGVARDDALRYNDAWGDCMLRVCLIASLVLLALSVSFGVEAGSGDQVPLRITEDPGADLAPAITVYPDGRVAISWQHYAADGSKAQLVLARSPEWSLLPVAPLSPSQAKRAHISLAATERLQADKFQSTTIKGEIETCLVARLMQQGAQEHMSAQALAEGMLDRALEADEHRPADDISVLVVAVLPNEIPDGVRHFSMSFPVEPEAVTKGGAFA